MSCGCAGGASERSSTKWSATVIFSLREHTQKVEVLKSGEGRK